MVEVMFAVVIVTIAVSQLQAFELEDYSLTMDNVWSTLVLVCVHIFGGNDEYCLKILPINFHTKAQRSTALT